MTTNSNLSLSFVPTVSVTIRFLKHRKRWKCPSVQPTKPEKNSILLRLSCVFYTLFAFIRFFLILIACIATAVTAVTISTAIITSLAVYYAEHHRTDESGGNKYDKQYVNSIHSTDS